jgi:hypothetical protein
MAIEAISSASSMLETIKSNPRDRSECVAGGLPLFGVAMVRHPTTSRCSFMAIHPGAYCMDVGAMANFKHDAADHSVAPVDQILLGVRLATCRWHRAVECELLPFLRGQKSSIKRDL